MKKGVWYELRCLICTELLHLALWVAPPKCVFSAVLAEGLHQTLKYLLGLEFNGTIEKAEK